MVGFVVMSCLGSNGLGCLEFWRQVTVRLFEVFLRYSSPYISIRFLQ